MHTYWKMIRSFNPNIVRFLGYNCAMTFAYIGTINVLMNLYLLRMGYSTQFIGAMVGSGMLLWGILALPAGAIGLRLGLKRAMLTSMLLMAFAAFLLVAAGWLPEPWRAPGLVGAWLILWGSAALVSVNSLPYVMAVTNDENRSYVFAVQQTLAAVVTLLGALVSGNLPGILARWFGITLNHPLPYQLTLLLGPLFYLVAAWVFSGASNIHAIDHQTSANENQPAPILLFLLLFVIVGLQSSGDGASRTFFNVYLDTQLNVPVAQIGAVLGLAQLLPALVSLIIPSLIHRIGSRGTMLVSNVLSIVFILLIALIPTSAAASLGFMGLAGLAAVTAISRSIFCQEIVSPRWRTTTSAIATIGISAGWAFSAWQGGSLVATLGFRGLFIIGAVLALLASLFIVIDGQRSKTAAARSDLTGASARPFSGNVSTED